MWSSDRLCGDLRQLHWLLNGRGLRYLRSSFHHLQIELLKINGLVIVVTDSSNHGLDFASLWHHHQLCHHALQLLGVDCACDVIHAVAQLLFPSFDTQALQLRNRILESTDHRTFAVVAIKLELKVLLEVRDTLVHIATAVHSTPAAQKRLRDVDRTHQRSATMRHFIVP